MGGHGCALATLNPCTHIPDLPTPPSRPAPQICDMFHAFTCQHFPDTFSKAVHTSR